MPESKKIREYRETLHDLATPRKKHRRKELEGKAATLGAEIHGEERKGRPKSRPGGKPRG